MTSTDKDIQDLLREFQKKLKDAQGRKITFLLLGRTGVGKSSTVNSLIGENVAPVGDFEPTTASVEIYEQTIEGVHHRIVDTPGLCDTDPQISHDRYYLGLVRNGVPDLDCMLFVTKLDETRLGGDEPRGIRLITESLGAQVWERSIIVFTFADKVDANKYQHTLTYRTSLIRKAIAKHIDTATANEIPVVAISNVSSVTPDNRLWLGELYTTVINRISKSGLLPFFLATAHRVEEAEYKDGSFVGDDSITRLIQDDTELPILITPRQKWIIISQLDLQVIPGLIAAGSAIGAVFGPTGVVVGGSIGAALGLLIWLFSK